MIGFEIPFARQISNVLDGRTANGTRAHSLWPLPKMHADIRLRRQILETSAWTLYALHDDLRARDEVRTLVIWGTAAQLWRLTGKGATLLRAAREVEWMSRVMAENPAFAATTLFVRKAIPDLAALTPVKDRTAARKHALAMYRALEATSRVNAHMPEKIVIKSRYSVTQHHTPQHFVGFTPISDRWRTHTDAMAADRHADHAYWSQVARRERMLFTVLAGLSPKACFDLHDGQVTGIVLVDPDDDTAHKLLATAFAELGNVARFPCHSSNSTIQALHAMRVPHPGAMMRNGDDSASPARKRAWRKSTETFLAYAVLAVALSYLVPLSIIAAPQLIRNYLHVWRAALSMEPACEDPEHCGTQRPRASSSAIPIPPHTGGKP